MKNLLLQAVQWDKVGIVIGIFALIAALLVALILLIAKLCKTDADETLEKVLENLAGANCGGCGCSGCAGFASKLCKGEASLSDCHVTSAENKRTISSLLNLPFEATKPTVSVCRCQGGENAKDAFSYVGATDCHQQAKLHGGAKACKFGCLGGGTCTTVCPEHTIHLEGKCAEVNPDYCISCGACIHNCPKELFMRIPADAKVYIACSSHERGKAVMDACKTGCIACGKCAKICPSDAIEMVDNLPVIDYEKCTRCGACADACPRHSIVKRY